MPHAFAGNAGTRERNPHVHAALRVHQRTPASTARGNPPLGHEPHHRRQRPSAHHQGRLDTLGPRANLLHRQRRLLLAQGRAEGCRGQLLRRQRRAGHLLRPRRARNGQETALDPHRGPLPRMALGRGAGLPEAGLCRRPHLQAGENRRLALRRRLPGRTRPQLPHENRARRGQGQKSCDSRHAVIRKSLPLRYGICRRRGRRFGRGGRSGRRTGPPQRKTPARVPVTRSRGLFRQLQQIL